MHPVESVTCTVYIPVSEAAYVWLTAPAIGLPLRNHWYVYPGPLLAVRVAGLFEQIKTGPAGEITAGGGGPIVTDTVVVAEHPSAENPVIV
jgi:hypothetical protein